MVTKEQRSKVLDNVYGALSRMIITNIEGVPLDHVNISKSHKSKFNTCI